MALRSNRRRTPAKWGAGRAHARTLTHTHTQACTHPHTHTGMHTPTHTHTGMHTHPHTHTGTHTDGNSGLTMTTDPVFSTMRIRKEAVLTPGRTLALTFQQVKVGFQTPRRPQGCSRGLWARGSGQPTQGTPPAGIGVVRGAARSCEHPECPHTPPPGPRQRPPSQDRLHNCGAHAGLGRPLAPHLSSPSWQRRELEQSQPLL